MEMKEHVKDHSSVAPQRKEMYEAVDTHKNLLLNIFTVGLSLCVIC